MNLQDLFDNTVHKQWTLTSKEKRCQSKSAEHIAKISATKSRSFMTPNGVFPSMKAAIEALGTYKGKMYHLMKVYPTQYYFIKEAK
jgi:hypothetical protein